jgi:RNA polymerase sigma factor (sigma-70 family)
MSDTWVIDASTRTLARLDGELRGYLRKRGRPNDEIESIVGRTWVAAGRVFEGRCSLRHFLFSVMRRLLGDYHRAAKRRPWFGSGTDAGLGDLPGSEMSFDSALSWRGNAERVRAALAKLPSHYADVVELVLEGHGHIAIAKILGIEYNTVRSRYSRGKAQLLALLEADGQ